MDTKSNHSNSDKELNMKPGRNPNEGIHLIRFMAVVIVMCAALTGCSAGTTTTVTRTSQPPASDSNAPVPTTTATRPRVQSFTGTGQKNLGTIVVPVDSTVSWNCPSCGSTNFIINNADGDDSTFPTNALDQTHGVDTLAAGTYHTVVVDTDAPGPWTIRVTSG